MDNHKTGEWVNLPRWRDDDELCHIEDFLKGEQAMKNLITARYTERYGGCWRVEILTEGNWDAFNAGEHQTKTMATSQIVRRMKREGEGKYQVVTPEQMDAEKATRKAAYL